jgi:phosphoglucosamine mutase
VGRLFGTDGVRGVANRDLTPELALALASAAADELVAHRRGGARRPLVVVGRDTRPSGEFLEAAVVAGLSAAGADVVVLGVVPTPTVACAVAGGLPDYPTPDLGVMISASHNPMPDNGIKLFGPGGTKLADTVEDAIEERLEHPWTRPTGDGVGRVHRPTGPATWYLDALLTTLPHSLAGLTVVVDCAQGAASAYAPELLTRAGATVIPLFDDPARSDGGVSAAINDGCGATHLEALQAAVLAHGADAGIAHDGDADRCLAVDATGAVVDGDQILAICALALQEEGRLKADTVVATVMSNLGFTLALRARGIEVVRSAVGDRYVLEAMRDGGFVLGGEQSGHLVFAEWATTGDGLLTALQLLGRMAVSGRSLAELAGVVQRLPQVLVNCRVVDRTVAGHPDVVAAVAAAEARLGDTGRVLVRPSGTEPLVRVMVEAPGDAEAAAVAEELRRVVAAADSAPAPRAEPSLLPQ